ETDRSASLIRLREFYWNYAEALGQSPPGHADESVSWNKVRTRAGLPALESGLSQSRMREQIRMERRIELCFEGKRWFDVRRWKIPDTEGSRQGGVFEGMDMTKGTSISSPEFYQRVDAVIRADW